MKSKKVIFIRSNGIDIDSRTQKEISILLKHYDVKVLCWDRDGKHKKDTNPLIHYGQVKGKYGGGIKNMLPMLMWWIYTISYLLFNKFDIVHACDFDTFFPALIAVKLKRKKIVYDMYDFYGDMVQVPKLLKVFIKKLDIFLVQFADGLIVVDENRGYQIKGSRPKNMIAIYNTPPDLYDRFSKNIEEKKKTDIFTMGYIGLIEKGRGCDILLDMVAEIPNARLILGGISVYETEEGLRKKMEGIPRVTFLGRVFPYEKTLETLAECDALFALYDPSSPTHKYSSANKIFESMMLGEPIIVAKNTGMDKIVEKYQTGLVVEYSDKEQIKKAILKLIDFKKNKNNFYGENARKTYLNIFNIKIMEAKIADFYAKILEK